MPKAKQVKSTLEPNSKPNTRTKKNSLDTELNNALALVSKDDEKKIEGIQHQGTKNLLAYHAKSKEVDLSETKKLSIDKHVERTRYKIAYVVDQLADELIREASKKTKKDKEHLKGITWAFGTLYDKLANISTDATAVALPSKLLANVTEMIKAQTELIKASQSGHRDATKQPVDITAQTEMIKATRENVRNNDVRSSPEVQDDKVLDVRSNDIRSQPDGSSTAKEIPT